MPISPSPIVQGYMNQPQEQGAPLSADQMFEKSFGDAAFTNLRSRFPELLNFVVTFKVLDADVETGRALGSFVVQSGRDLRYIPVAMSGGNITSCELIYDKDSDQFVPMSKDNVQRLVSSNMVSEGSIMQGNAVVEDTKDLFRSIVRPPASSSVVLASDRNLVSGLPEHAKEAVRSWLNANHTELAKIACVYDVNILGRSLAPSQEKTASDCEKKKDKEVLDLKTVSKKMVDSLSYEEKQRLLKEGYLVKRAEESSATAVPVAGFAASMETELKLEQYTHVGIGEDRTVRTAQAVTFVDGGLKMLPAIITRSGVFFEDGNSLRGSAVGTILVKDMSEAVTSEDLKACGALTAEELRKKDLKAWTFVIPVYPVRQGWRVHDSTNAPFYFREKMKCTKINDDYFFDCGAGQEFHVTPHIAKGCVCAEKSCHLPAETMFFVADDREEQAPRGLLRSFDELRRIMVQRGKPITVTGDGITISITEVETKKTANFLGKVAAAQWLLDKYDLGHDQVSKVLDSHTSVIFNKQAFEAPQVDPNTGMELPVAPMVQPVMQMPMQPVMGMAQAPVQFNPAPIQYAAEIGDPDAIDTGILASFAQDPDIKAYLVDYLPDFQNMLDKLARIILLFSLEKDELETFYGSDKYASVLGSCRKMFKLMGDTTESLQRYIRMA